MTTAGLHPDAIRAKFTTLKVWRDSRSGRRAFLTGWKVTRLEGGQLHVSARIRGADAERAFRQFVDWQSRILAQQMGPDSGDVMPALDVSRVGRTAAVWRLSGVWVEVWHPDTTPTGLADAEDAPGPPLLLASSPGGRLPYTRRSKTPGKEVRPV